MTKRLFLIIMLCFVALFTFGQPIDKEFTPEQIIQKAIDNSGGDKNLDSITGLETISQIITASGDSLSFAVKKINFDKYYISTLSLKYENSTTFFNNGKAVLVKNQNSQEVQDKLELEDLKLQSYISIDYGYKKLNYKLERQKDEKFEHFDCYVILITSPLGKSSLNYYDKQTGNLTMIIFPNGSKAVFIDFHKDKGIVLPSKILMVDTLNQISTSTLTKINYDKNLDANWFIVPPIGNNSAFETFKTGTFKYLNSDDGARIIRKNDKQIETFEEWKKEYKIDWSTNNDYLIYRLKNDKNPPTNDNCRKLL